MRTSELDEDYDTVVAVHGFNLLAPQDPDTKDFRPVASSESYAAPRTDEEGNVTEENPGVFFGERGNKLRPAINVLDEGILSLLGDKISEKTSEIRDTLNR